MSLFGSTFQTDERDAAGTVSYQVITGISAVPTGEGFGARVQAHVSLEAGPLLRPEGAVGALHVLLSQGVCLAVSTRKTEHTYK